LDILVLLADFLYFSKEMSLFLYGKAQCHRLVQGFFVVAIVNGRI